MKLKILHSEDWRLEKKEKEEDGGDDITQERMEAFCLS